MNIFVFIRPISLVGYCRKSLVKSGGFVKKIKMAGDSTVGRLPIEGGFRAEQNKSAVLNIKKKMMLEKEIKFSLETIRNKECLIQSLCHPCRQY